LLSEVGFRLAGAETPLILVPTHVNGRGPYEFILDTGAGISLITPRLAEELGIAASGAREGRGAVGRGPVAMARVEALAVGAAHGGGMTVGIAADLERIGAAVGHRIEGDIGYDFLKAFRLTIDYRRRVVRLAPGGPQSGFAVTGPGSSAHAEVPFRLAAPAKPLVLVPAFVNGRGPHTFVLDTGASATVLSPELAAALRIETAAAEPMTGNGGMLQATLGRASSLTVGEAALQDVAVMVSDSLADLGGVVGTPLDGILGYNFLRHFRVTLDYPVSTLWLMKAV
jgi:predicted aspartyl protease